MKRILHLALTLSFILAIAAPAAAQSPGGLTYNSGYQVQNLGTDTANVVFTFYNASDGNALGTTVDTIAVAKSKTYFPITLPSSATNFNGSMVISSDQQVAAIVNLVNNDFSYVDTYGGFSAGATTFNLPLIMCNNSGYNTFFNVQNAGSADANVTVTYSPGSSGNAGITDTVTLKSGATKMFDQATTSTTSTKTCTQLGSGTGTKFVGSAQVTSDQPIVAAVMQLNTTNFKALIGYNGFAAGSTTVAAPLVMAGNAGYFTGIQVQNVGTASTVVTVTYAANTVVNTNIPAPESFTLAPGASNTVLQNGGQWTAFGRYVGSAVVTNSGGQALVAIVNQVFPSATAAKGAAYDGFNPSAATGTINAPLITSANGGFFTGIQIMNVGTASCTGSVAYAQNTVVNTNTPAADNFTLAAGASTTFIQSGSGGFAGANNWTTFGRYVGGATVTGTGCKLVAIVNQTSATAAGDAFSAYNAFNQ
jgi:hypothetical protein